MLSPESDKKYEILSCIEERAHVTRNNTLDIDWFNAVSIFAGNAFDGGGKTKEEAVGNLLKRVSEWLDEEKQLSKAEVDRNMLRTFLETS